MLWRGQSLDAALPRALRKIEGGPDRALARNIASLVLRWLPDLDALIDDNTERMLPAEAPARMVIRMGLVQALLMDTPHHAAISTALPLVEGGPRRLVHGVLGAILRAGLTLPEHPQAPNPWAMRWQMYWGDDVVDAAGRALAEPPPTDLTFKGEVQLAGFSDGAMSLLPGHLRIPSGGRIEALPGFAEGDWWVQDLAASLPARLLAAKAGERILDVAAAPGGKTMQLAATGAQVTALDNSGPRLERLRENMERTGLSANILEIDARKYEPEDSFDAVLLDAPCSATGIFRRHPDVLYLRKPTTLKEIVAVQAAMLNHAANWVRPGGRLVYSVCSLERQEGEDQLRAFLERSPGWRIDAIPADALPGGVAPTAEGWVRTLPGQLSGVGGMDGFFMARLTRD